MFPVTPSHTRIQRARTLCAHNISPHIALGSEVTMDGAFYSSVRDSLRVSLKQHSTVLRALHADKDDRDFRSESAPRRLSERMEQFLYRQLVHECCRPRLTRFSIHHRRKTTGVYEPCCIYMTRWF